MLYLIVGFIAGLVVGVVFHLWIRATWQKSVVTIDHVKDMVEAEVKKHIGK
jgi:hypothetical protein